MLDTKEKLDFWAGVDRVCRIAGLELISGQRTFLENRAANGEPDSLHLEGLAADLDALGYGVVEYTAAAELALAIPGIAGAVVYDTPTRSSMHLQARPLRNSGGSKALVVVTPVGTRSRAV